MGFKAEESLDLSFDEFANYLRAHTRIFMDVEGKEYYLTHTDGYWRAQDCAVLNDKGHFTDCSELVPLLSEFLGLPWLEGGKSITDVFESATFWKSIQEGWED